jgi:hypothetical protein
MTLGLTMGSSSLEGDTAAGHPLTATPHTPHNSPACTRRSHPRLPPTSDDDPGAQVARRVGAGKGMIPQLVSAQADPVSVVARSSASSG